MKIEQRHWTRDVGWSPPAARLNGAQWVLAFGSSAALRTPDLPADLRRAYPGAYLMGCSTAGEICGERVWDDSVVVTAVEFAKSAVEGHAFPLTHPRESRDVGGRIARALQSRPGLSHVFVLSEGVHVNGTELVAGLTDALPPGVRVTGGLAGDGPRFRETLVMANGPATPNQIAAVGLYGSELRIGFGSLGGWDPFGPERLVTRSQDNILYELDGQSALELYKNYLGDQAEGLPASGLLFPLSVRGPEEKSWVVRTILGVNEADRSMTFAGNVPTGHRARFMRANFDRLIDGAGSAADGARHELRDAPAELALLVSCVGRKLVLKKRVHEEVETVRHALGHHPVIAGFYSYGEISPAGTGAPCALHNQTMTITALSEG